jgi:hypothetical protein
MALVKDEYVEFILKDISNRGVVINDLKENILDHICCIIEKEMPDDANFHVFYQEIIPRFFNNDLREIQKETEYLLDNKYISGLTKLLKISGVVSVLILLFGICSKLNHLRGTGILLLVGVLVFSLVFLPTLILLKFKDKALKSHKFLVILGFLIALMASITSLFKIMEWPFATLLKEISIITFLVLFVPIYYFLTKNIPEKKFTALINTVIMLVIGLLLFGMSI